MKSSVVALFFTIIASTLAMPELNITTPNMGTVWHFGNVELVQWVTEGSGEETGYLFYFEGDPTQCKEKKALMEIPIKYLENKEVYFDLRDSVEDIDFLKKSLPKKSNNYFVRIGTDRNQGYSTRFTIEGGELTDEQIQEYKAKNDAPYAYYYTTILAVAIGIITTLINIL